MNLKEKLKMVVSCLEIEKEVQTKRLELDEINRNLESKKIELESLKTEIIELKDFMNSKFKEEFEEYDYEVDITNCYVIGMNGKKYITLRKHSSIRSNWSTLATGCYNVEVYSYYDVLNVNNKKYKFLFEYSYSHDDNNCLKPRLVGEKPDYEEHILEFYPDLKIFADNYVPNTYLKEII